MTRTYLLIVTVCFGLFNLTGHAQTPADSVKKLAVFVGSWTFEWDVKASIFGPAGKITGVERYEWAPGGFFVQMNREAKGPAGDFRNLVIFGYDPALKKYTQTVFNLNSGWLGAFSGTENLNTWNWSGSGTGFEQRCAWIIATGGASRTVKCEVSTDGKTWSVTEEGTYRKSN